jgi:hypothetical protein
MGTGGQLCVCVVLIRNGAIDKCYCPDIMKLGVISRMANLKIGLLGIGALGFIAGIALEDMMIMIGSVLFTCVAAVVVFGPGD